MTVAPSRAAAQNAIGDVLESRLLESPKAVAIATADGIELTRAELLGDLRRRADRIDEVAGGTGFVEIVGDGGLETALSCLAVALSGRAYAVVAADWPAPYRERVRERLRPAAAIDAIHDHHVVAPTPWSGTDAHADDKVHPRERPCCVFFTSGTTGDPKGVVIPHRAMLRTCVSPAFLDTRGALRMPQLAPLTWDAGALELWAPLLSGGTCLIPARGVELLDSLQWAIGQARANALWLTASLGNFVADTDPKLLEGLDVLMVGGERLSEPHVARIARAVPSLRILNGYGPVESTVFATTHEIDPAVDLDGSGVPLGRPIRETAVSVVDEHGLELTVGSAGEIVVRGDGVALGYLGIGFDADGRSGGFRRLPDGRGLEYWTGDLGRIRPDGLLEFLGRRDSQVKVAGVRVDAVGLERRIMAVDGVRQAAVVRRLDGDGNALALTAQVVCAPGVAEDAVLADIAASFEKVPDGAGPSDVRIVPALPHSSNGKVDRAKVERELRQSDRPISEPKPEKEGVQSDLERAVESVLGRVDPTRSLVDQGMSSLLALRLAGALRAMTGRGVSVADLYRLNDLDSLRTWLPGQPTAQATPMTANLVADIAARYWTSESIAPRSEAHLVVCRFRGTTATTEPAEIEHAIRGAAARYLLGVRGIVARLSGIARTAEIVPAVQVEVDDAPWGDDVARARGIMATAAGLHDLERGPLMAFAAARAGRTVEVLGVFHHVIVDGESLRTIGALLEHALDEPTASDPPPLASALRRPLEWGPEDLEYWLTTLDGIPRLPIPDAPCGDLADVWRSHAVIFERAIGADVREGISRSLADAQVPELAAYLHRVVHALRGELDVGSLCVGTMVRTGHDGDALARGCLAQPVPIAIDASATTVGEVGSAVLDAFAHATVPYSEILTAAAGHDAFGPFRVIVNLQDERPRPGGREHWLPESLPPTAPVAELYVEFVLRPDSPPVVRIVTPDAPPYRAIGARLADHITRGARG